MKKNKKVFLIIMIVLFLFLLIDYVIHFIFNKSFYDENKNIGHTLPITYLVMDESNTPDNVTSKQATYEYNNYILYSTVGYVLLEEKGDYYVAKYDNTNAILRKNIASYSFSYNDITGNVINDATFNKKNIKIPKKYYNKFKKGEKEPVQMEIVVRTKNEDLKNISINVENKGKKVIQVNGKNKTTSFSILNYNKGKYLTKKDINIYINGSSLKVGEKYYYWDSLSGTIQLDIDPILINDIKINIRKKSIIEKILSIKNIFATTDSYDEMASSGELYSEPSLSVNDEIILKDIQTFYFWPSTAQQCLENSPNCTYPKNVVDAYKNGDSYLYTSCSDGSCTISEEAYEDFVLVLDGTYTSGDKSINFKSNTPVLLYCGDHSTSASNENPNHDFKVNVIAKGDDYIILQFLGVDTGNSSWQGGQIPAGVLKFTWEVNNKGLISAKKKLLDKDGNELVNRTFKIAIYKNADSGEQCASSNRIKTQTVKSGRKVTWTNLEFGTYWLKETVCDSNLYRCDTSCKKVVLNNDDCTGTLDSNGVCSTDRYADNTYVATPITNYVKYYCVKVKKNDAEYSNDCAVKDIKFKLVSSTTSNPSYSNEQTTNSNGRVQFTYLKYQDYYLSETSSDPTKATLYCNGTKKADYNYWNENASTSTVSKSDLTEMNWNSSSKKYESCPDSATANAVIKSDHKKYYCVAVKKIDSKTKSPLAGAQFTVNNNASAYPQYNGNGEQNTTIVKGNNAIGDGVAYFFLGTTSSNVKIKETIAPLGYSIGAEITATPVAMPKGTKNDGTKGSSSFVETCRAAYNNINTPVISYPDDKYVINWYKTTENGTAASGAKFRVKYTDSKNITHYVVAKSAKAEHTDASNVKKSCYVYDSLTTDDSKATEFISDSDGETCISGIIDNGKKKYSVEETESAEYHTFGKNKVKQIDIGTSFTLKDATVDSNTNKNKFVNYDTVFEFTKTVSSGDDEDVNIIVNGQEKNLKDLTTEELKLLEFNVTDKDNKVLSFILKDGVYEYAKNTIDKPEGTSTTTLHLDDNRKITIKHLSKGTYSIKEKNSKTCDESSNYNDCVGYYYPNYTSDSSHKFIITNCSSANATSCTTHVSSKQTLGNKPTEITFTKKDFYSYYDVADKNKSDSNVTFENDKERNDFDKIVFKIKDSNGNYLTLKKVRDVGDCSTDSSYSEYRYVKSDQTDSKGTELHTCGGHIKITNLCRGNEYTVEEISVPDGSVYVKENTESTPTSVKYKIPCAEGDTNQSTTTNLISDKPTRVRFEKRDSKYNYLIQDETTTFEVYKCAKGTECHPADYTTKEEREKNGMTLIKFNPRAVITDDEEDPTDAEGLQGVEVYRKISDSDVSKGQKYETSLHPYNGILVLRYLESNYRYVLLETVAPKNYILPSGRNAETGFTVTNTTVKVDEVDVPNKPTSLIIRKYSDTGELLPGAEFKIYEGKTCDANLSAMNQPKTLLKLKTIRDGVYENRPTKDTDTVLTCTDRDGEKCSEINTKLTYNDYADTWANFDETLNTEKNKVEIKQGEALIQYLEYDHCYIIEEVKAPKGYSLPKNEEDRYTLVTIPKNTEYASDTYKALINKPTPFTFYKYDEYNGLLDGAEFKLQKLDDNKKYHDMTVTKEETENRVYYKADESSDNKIITTKNGSATVYYLEEGQYRIVEVTPAPGKELSKNPNIATFFVDSSGNVYGNSIIVNKSKTEKLEVKSSSSAELVVSIQTGQKVIRYGLVIATIVSVITALMIMLRIYNKKSE